jgi:C_GCAxxG_C_C family probable redox protein
LKYIQTTITMNSRKLFEQGYNCAQSVFVPFALENKIERETALKMMSPYGGGIAKTDNLCGAVTGGIAAIGLKLGHSRPDDTETKLRCNEATQRFLTAFKKKHGSIYCSKLIGYNLGNENEKKQAEESGITDTKCPLLVEFSANLVKEISG